MKIIEINNENFENEVLNSNIPVLADFNAEWCGPCRILKPLLEEIAAEEKEIKIVSINIDNEDELAEKFEVTSIPCLILFNSGKEVVRSIGLKSKDDIKNMLGGK